MPASFSNASEVGEVVHHAAQVVDSIGVGDVGVPALALTHFLGAAMMEADFRHRIHDHLAIKLKHNTQHAVGSGMLRPHIEKDEVFIVVAPLHSPFLGTETQRLLLCLLFFLRQVEGTHFGRPRRMILSQWMASPGLRHQNSGQVRMILEHDAEHVPDFALIPVGRWPDVGSSIQSEVVVS